MGASLGLALTLSGSTALLTFTMLGLGLAFPYALLVMQPILLRFLPKPGGWMVTFKQAMAFTMYAVMIGLLWLLSRQVTDSIWLPMCVVLLMMAIASWIYGKWSRPHLPLGVKLIAILSSALLMIASIYYVVNELRSMEVIASSSKKSLTSSAKINPNANLSNLSDDNKNVLRWHPYSEEMIKNFRLRHPNRAVFVNFTADWCVSCKVNEKLVLTHKKVQSAFRKYDVLLVKGDWTLYAPAITQAIESFGRSGVPVYVMYPPGEASAPRVLPEILTKDMLVNLLAEVYPSTR